MSHVKLINAALDEDKDGEIILRGRLVPDTLQHLKTDIYQRERLPIANKLELSEAFQHGSVPDINLGMRGGNYTDEGGVVTLLDPTYIVDGLQRTTAALEVMKSNIVPRLGAMVYFNTTMEGERRRFHILNTKQQKLSPNVLLRNMITTSPCIQVLHNLTLDSSFPLCRRVNWDQRQHKEHLLSALTLLKTVSHLHSAFQSGLRDTQHADLVQAMDKLQRKIGNNAVRANTMMFWQVIEECYGIQNIEMKQFAPQIKLVFLVAIAVLMSNHTDFWADSHLVVGRSLRSKLSKFGIHDPHVVSLCSAGGITGGARKILYHMLVDHVNSGKRTRHLSPRKGIEKYADNVTPIHMNDIHRIKEVMADVTQ